MVERFGALQSNGCMIFRRNQGARIKTSPQKPVFHTWTWTQLCLFSSVYFSFLSFFYGEYESTVILFFEYLMYIQYTYFMVNIQYAQISHGSTARYACFWGLIVGAGFGTISLAGLAAIQKGSKSPECIVAWRAWQPTKSYMIGIWWVMLWVMKIYIYIYIIFD